MPLPSRGKIPTCVGVVTGTTGGRGRPRTFAEVTVLMLEGQLERGCVQLRRRDGPTHRIDFNHRSFDPLHFVLLFPCGDDGWLHPLFAWRTSKSQRRSQRRFPHVVGPGGPHARNCGAPRPSHRRQMPPPRQKWPQLARARPPHRLRDASLLRRSPRRVSRSHADPHERLSVCAACIGRRWTA